MLSILAVSVLTVCIVLLDLLKGEYVPFLVVLQLFGSGIVIYFLDQVLDDSQCKVGWNAILR
jgi:hypothetical protein